MYFRLLILNLLLQLFACDLAELMDPCALQYIDSIKVLAPQFRDCSYCCNVVYDLIKYNVEPKSKDNCYNYCSHTHLVSEEEKWSWYYDCANFVIKNMKRVEPMQDCGIVANSYLYNIDIPKMDCQCVKMWRGEFQG